jgi:hypothetical protein
VGITGGQGRILVAPYICIITLLVAYVKRKTTKYTQKQSILKKKTRWRKTKRVNIQEKAVVPENLLCLSRSLHGLIGRVDVDFFGHKVALEALGADAEGDGAAADLSLNLQEVRLP